MSINSVAACLGNFTPNLSSDLSFYNKLYKSLFLDVPCYFSSLNKLLEKNLQKFY